MALEHLSIDLETLGTAPGSVILSIGAVAFDPVWGVMAAPFYANLEVVPQQVALLKIDPDTVAWWAEQSAEARGRLEVGIMSPSIALHDLAAYWDRYGCRYPWGHGAGFDVTLLEELHRAFSHTVPWDFRNVRDLRTLLDLSGVRVNRDKGLLHDAADDARNQAEAVIAAYRALGLAGSPLRQWVGRKLRAWA